MRCHLTDTAHAKHNRATERHGLVGFCCRLILTPHLDAALFDALTQTQGSTKQNAVSLLPWDERQGGPQTRFCESPLGAQSVHAVMPRLPHLSLDHSKFLVNSPGISGKGVS